MNEQTPHPGQGEGPQQVSTGTDGTSLPRPARPSSRDILDTWCARNPDLAHLPATQLLDVEVSQLAELAVVALRAALAPVVDELRGAREELAGARGELSKIHSEVSSLEHFVRLGVVEWANR